MDKLILRRGIIEISNVFIENNPSSLKILFKHFIPISIIKEAWTYKYFGYSEMFDIIETEGIIPKYTAIISSNGLEETIKFNKV